MEFGGFSAIALFDPESEALLATAQTRERKRENIIFHIIHQYVKTAWRSAF